MEKTIKLFEKEDSTECRKTQNEGEIMEEKKIILFEKEDPSAMEAEDRPTDLAESVFSTAIAGTGFKVIASILIQIMRGTSIPGALLVGIIGAAITIMFSVISLVKAKRYTAAGNILVGRAKVGKIFAIINLIDCVGGLIIAVAAIFPALDFASSLPNQ